ncbi:metal-dependent hydrolase [Acidobacteria bacterium AH-259-O06]|nr:metal-dependent hydrolase [Acidobacteria bacterium AH-259-O06]
MTSSSHLASSALFYLGASALAESPITIEGLAVTAVGSLLPDIDTPTSTVGRPFYPVASWIDQKIGHRTLTHSLLGCVIFAFLVLGVAWLLSGGMFTAARTMQYSWLLVLGYGSHILVDTLNKTGVELFWPSKLRCVFFYNDNWRITAAGKGDYWFMTACLVLNLALYPLARDGFTLSLHRAFGDIYSVSMDFKQYGDKNRIWLELEGVEAISNQKVKGRFEILAALDNGAVLIERGGVKQIVSRTKPFQIFPHKVKITVGEKQHIATREINMAGRTLVEIARFSDAQRVLLHGYLTPARFTPVSVYENRYNPISLRLDKLRLEHADYRDIREQGLEHVAIREGMLILKIHRLEAVAEAEHQNTNPDSIIRHVELRFKPTDEVLFGEGHVIQAGQTIGREDICVKVEKLEQDYGRDLERLNEQLREVQIQLSQSRRRLSETRAAARRLESELASLESQALFVREYWDLQGSLASLMAQAQADDQKVAALERKERQLKAQIQARGEQLSENIEVLDKQAEIPASFRGQVVRIDKKPDNHVVVYSILYREVQDTGERVVLGSQPDEEK